MSDRTKRAIITTAMMNLASENERNLATLSDDLKLTESGLESIDLAILIARLEEEVGFDPFFAAGDGDDVPITFGELVSAYEKGPAPISGYKLIIDEISSLNWSNLTEEDVARVAWAYYHFSVQFRECLEIARKLHPDDEHLLRLDREERNTDNLSPWPGVAKPGEKMNHDEFMRRTLALEKIPSIREESLSEIGTAYLDGVRAVDPKVRALALASYEDGGLEKTFRAILKAPSWSGPLQQAFKHFLEKHIQFDSDPDEGHGALCRHLPPDDSVAPLWAAFKKMLIKAAPNLQ
jgi:hypothetical protein